MRGSPTSRDLFTSTVRRLTSRPLPSPSSEELASPVLHLSLDPTFERNPPVDESESMPSTTGLLSGTFGRDTTTIRVPIGTFDDDTTTTSTKTADRGSFGTVITGGAARQLLALVVDDPLARLASSRTALEATSLSPDRVKVLGSEVASDFEEREDLLAPSYLERARPLAPQTSNPGDRPARRRSLPPRRHRPLRPRLLHPLPSRLLCLPRPTPMTRGISQDVTSLRKRRRRRQHHLPRRRCPRRLLLLLRFLSRSCTSSSLVLFNQRRC